ncbi:putative exported protein [Halobacteriovorax marinus SJ]|uniref:Exported protein n=1 Tax=Halobacteriovorax marinus (strain ATCC BAA-682 / DSM 15412 / SJ) TaxID=862908 RepID=E1WY30_HALMS|nr:hypothetical protein [Halobacteriovorax marinus]CBW27585.1 putative exported protein [Halobacteriovorax marinus SJ]
MKKFFLLFTLLLVSCNKEAPIASKSVNSVKKETPNYDFSKKSNSMAVKDDFSDLKKVDDESCETEEELKEKLAKPKQEAFQLQGGDTGCDVSAAK